MNWIVTAIISAAFLSLSNVIAKLYQSKISLGAGMIIFSLGVLVVSVLVTLISKTPFTTSKSLQSAVWLALVYGIIWALGQIFFLTTLAKNAPISLAIPIIVGGIATGGALAGVAFFGETLSLMRVIGIITILTGTVILSR